MSDLHRLLHRTTAGDRIAEENFTTEALANCIRRDSAPIVRLLRTARLVDASESVERVVASTQFGIANAGIIDLGLEVYIGGVARWFWIEVKVRAPESGDQLSRYVRWIETQAPPKRPTLVVLARHDFSPNEDVPLIQWQSLWAAIGKDDDSSHWQDFRLFLQEIGMADTFDAPVTTRESASLTDAANLFRKAERILLPVGQYAQTVWPAGNWPSDEAQVRRQLASEFITHRKGRFTIGTRRKFKAWPWAGIFPHEGEAWLAVHVNQDPRHAEVRFRLLEQATQGGLPSQWQRHPEGWTTLSCWRRLVLCETHAQASEWLNARVQELKHSKILDLIPALGTPAPEPAATSDGEDEGASEDGSEAA